jgi:hypothetical protein
MYLYGFNLFTFTNTWLESNLSIIINNIILLGLKNCIIKVQTTSLWTSIGGFYFIWETTQKNHQTWIVFLDDIIDQFHIVFFPYWTYVIFSRYNLSPCSFSRLNIILVNMCNGFASLWSPLMISKTYFISMNQFNK